MSTYHRRPKAEAFSNAVDVVELLQLNDVPRTLDSVEADGEFRQHDGVAMVIMMLPAQGFA